MDLYIILVYVDVGLSASQSAVLSAVTSGSSFSRSFSVKVSQIECTALSRGEKRKKKRFVNRENIHEQQLSNIIITLNYCFLIYSMKHFIFQHL
jgi:hypothetical protein